MVSANSYLILRIRDRIAPSVIPMIKMISPFMLCLYKSDKLQHMQKRPKKTYQLFHKIYPSKCPLDVVSAMLYQPNNMSNINTKTRHAENMISPQNPIINSVKNSSISFHLVLYYPKSYHG